MTLLDHFQPEQRPSLGVLGRIHDARTVPLASNPDFDRGRVSQRGSVTADLGVQGAWTADEADGSDVEVAHPTDGTTGESNSRKQLKKA